MVKNKPKLKVIKKAPNNLCPACKGTRWLQEMVGDVKEGRMLFLADSRCPDCGGNGA